MRTALVTLYHPNFQALADITLPNWNDYCSIHGYKIYAHCGQYGNGRVGFQKIQFLYNKMFVENKFDVAYVLGLDVLITNHIKTIESFIVDKSSSMFIAADWGMAANMDSFIIKNTLEAKAILEHLMSRWNLDPDEQWTFNHTLPKALWNSVKILPQPSINSFPFSLFKNKLGEPEDIEKLTCLSPDIYRRFMWEPGHFVAHACGRTLEERLDIFSNKSLLDSIVFPDGIQRPSRNIETKDLPFLDLSIGDTVANHSNSIQDTLKDIKVVFEIGVGHASLCRSAKWLGTNTRVEMFEPNLDNYYSLLERYGSFNNVHIHNVALFDEDTEKDLVEDGDSSWIEGIVSPAAFRLSAEEVKTRQRKKISCHSISRYDRGDIDVALIDTEGCEYKILSKMVSRPRLLVLEMRNGDYCTPNSDLLKTWLKENDYFLMHQKDGDDYYLRKIPASKPKNRDTLNTIPSKIQEGKNAVILFGEARTFDMCYSAIKEFIVDPFKPDIFISTWESLYCMDEKFSIKDYLKAYNPTDGCVEKLYENDTFKPERTNTKTGAYFTAENRNRFFRTDLEYKIIPSHGDGHRIASILAMYYKQWKGFQMIIGTGKKYDCVFLLRPDLIINEMLLPPTISPNTIYTEILWHTGTAISDTIAFGDYNSMKIYCSLWEKIEEYSKIPECSFHPETLIKFHLDRHGIKIVTKAFKCTVKRPSSWDGVSVSNDNLLSDIKNLRTNEQKSIKLMHWPFFGAFMQQTPNAVLSINRLLNAYDFARILEIGTHDGGLSALFAFYCFLSRRKSNVHDPVEYKNKTFCKHPKEFYTFDIVVRDDSMTEFIKSLGGYTIIQNVFEEPCVSGLGKIIGRPGKTLLICDGGDKKKELDTYAKSMKEGDIVLVHDWAADEKSFEDKKQRGIWYGWETKWENKHDGDIGLKDICEKYNVVQIHADEFDDVVWFCGMKSKATSE